MTNTKTIIVTLIALVVISGAATVYADSLRELYPECDAEKFILDCMHTIMSAEIIELQEQVATLQNLPVPTNGIDGVNGTNGIDGANGQDGINGVDGSLFDDSGLQAQLDALEARITALEPIVSPSCSSNEILDVQTNTCVIPTIPNFVVNNIGFWLEQTLTDNALVNSLNFLDGEGIVSGTLVISQIDPGLIDILTDFDNGVSTTAQFITAYQNWLDNL